MIRDLGGDHCRWCGRELLDALRVERVEVRVTAGEHAGHRGVGLLVVCAGCEQVTPLLWQVAA